MNTIGKQKSKTKVFPFTENSFKYRQLTQASGVGSRGESSRRVAT